MPLPTHFACVVLLIAWLALAVIVACVGWAASRSETW